MKISVMVPSYRRPEALQRCLEAIHVQERQADQVLVVVRQDDDETLSVLQSRRNHMHIEVVKVSHPGVVHAMNRGLAQAECDIVAITDDDAAPRVNWLAMIEAHFVANPMLGGVGGRDWLNHDGLTETRERTLVGRILWYGRVVGNHHRGVGPPREVDILKGANCAFRTDTIKSIGFDTRLQGDGAQVHWEMCLCLALKRAGWKLIYDPAVAVDHYPGPRYNGNMRNKLDQSAAADAAYNFNLALALLSSRQKRLAAYAWQYIVGTQAAPGLLNLIRMLAKGDAHALGRFRATAIGFARARR